MNYENANEPLDLVGTEAASASSGPARRRWLRASAAAALVAAGGLGSWVLAQPSNSSAIESADSAADDAATDDSAGPGFGHRHGGHGPGLDAAAEALGLTTDELRTQLQGGATLAEIAAAQNVAVDDLVAAMVAAAEADIDARVEAGDIDQARADEIKANLTERITAMVNGEMGGPGGPGGRGGPGGHHGGPGFGRNLDTAAEVLGLTTDELRAELESGKTLAEVAADQNVDVDTLIDALVADARERITDMVNGVRPEEPADAPTDSTAPTDAAS